MVRIAGADIDNKPPNALVSSAWEDKNSRLHRTMEIPAFFPSGLPLFPLFVHFYHFCPSNFHRRGAIQISFFPLSGSILPPETPTLIFCKFSYFKFYFLAVLYFPVLCFDVLYFGVLFYGFL